MGRMLAIIFLIIVVGFPGFFAMMQTRNQWALLGTAAASALIMVALITLSALPRSAGW